MFVNHPGSIKWHSIHKGIPAPDLEIWVWNGKHHRIEFTTSCLLYFTYSDCELDEDEDEPDYPLWAYIYEEDEEAGHNLCDISYWGGESEEEES